MAKFIHVECVQEAQQKLAATNKKNTKGSDIAETPNLHMLPTTQTQQK